MAWDGRPEWPGIGGTKPDNEWFHQRESDQADVVRRGVQYESLSGAQAIRYSNGDVWYLVSASAAATTIVFGSATANTGATNTVRNLAAGPVIASTAGGTLEGSATQSANGATTIWRSDGAVWRRLFGSEEGGSVPDPLSVGVLNAGSVSVSANVLISGHLTVNGSSTFSGTAYFISGINLSGLTISGSGVLNTTKQATFSDAVILNDVFISNGSASFSCSVLFVFQPNFPAGNITSITGGAMITHAGNRLYEISCGGSDVIVALPSATGNYGLRAAFKVKSTTGGQILVTTSGGGGIEGSGTASSTVTISGALSAATFMAGQTTWWII